MSLDIGVKNKIKAALIEGTEISKRGNLGDGELLAQPRLSPEVIVNAKLPELVIKATPDVYNGLVNLNQILISEG